jgi:hypothetical protein
MIVHNTADYGKGERAGKGPHRVLNICGHFRKDDLSGVYWPGTRKSLNNDIRSWRIECK